MKGKPFEELFEKKTLWDNQTQDRLFFFTSLNNYNKSISEHNPLCLHYLTWWESESGYVSYYNSLSIHLTIFKQLSS